jgi:mono/diheme cytochrome c family protein
MPKADIGEGKVIFLRDCGKCHYGKNIESYTKEQWANILPRMTKKAELDETETRQITAYIAWELEND